MDSNLIDHIDQAAHWTDRGLFVAALIILGLVATVVAKYFVRQHESLIADHKEARSAYHTQMEKMVVEHQVNNARMVVALEHNTEAWNRACRHLARLEEA